MCHIVAHDSEVPRSWINPFLPTTYLNRRSRIEAEREEKEGGVLDV